MRQNCQLYQWYQNNPFAPSRRVFEHGSVEPIDEDPEGVAETARAPEPTSITLRSAEIREVTIPESTKKAKVQAATGVRIAVAEALEERVARLERENTEQKAALAERDEEVARLKRKDKESKNKLAKKDKKNKTLELENKKLEKKAIKDKLTGLHSKNYFMDRITQVTSDAIRHGKDFSVVFVDLDKFKDINDTKGLGHPAGDAALRKVGEIIKKVFRKADVKCRFGGEELVVILPGTSREKAAIVAERLRKAIEDGLSQHLKDKGYDETLVDNQMCTASIGISSFAPETRTEDEIKKLDEVVVKEADKAMYKAKAAGRNRVYVHGEEAISKKKVRKAILKAAIESEELEAYVAKMRQMAEQEIPEADLREQALRQAADQTRDALR